jgi:hypothetical protein
MRTILGPHDVAQQTEMTYSIIFRGGRSRVEELSFSVPVPSAAESGLGIGVKREVIIETGACALRFDARSVKEREMYPPRCQSGEKQVAVGHTGLPDGHIGWTVLRRQILVRWCDAASRAADARSLSLFTTRAWSGCCGDGNHRE